MINFPLVSVVMCSYNGAQFIDEQVDSILRQDYPNMELLIVDDQSKDNTWMILQTLQKQNSRMRLVQNDVNVGYNQNFAKAIHLATGDFIALADQDDVWLPDKITKIMAAFADNDVVLAHCKSVRLENGKLNYRLAKLHYHFSGSDSRQLFPFNHIMGHDAIFRKQLVKHILPIPTGMSYDWWIAVVATCHGTVASVDKYLVHHRIHGQNNFFSTGTTAKSNELDIDETLGLFLTIPALSSKTKDYFSRFFDLLQRHRQYPNGTFDAELFLFFCQNAVLIFGHKRRLFPIFSYFKNAIKYARINYAGKGLSI